MCKQTITKTQAVYNRSKKAYEVISPWGEIVATFPGGEKGKRAAELESIRTDDPQAYQVAADLRFNLFTSYPETWSRIWKAARIVADGQAFTAHPLSPNSGQEAYHVKSQREELFYTVTRESDLYACTCPDFDEFHAPTVQNQKLCKHIFAIKITKIMERPFPAYLDSPKNIWRFLEETTASYKVIGAYNHHPHLYATPQQRPAVAGEIVEVDDETYRLTHNGQRFGTWKITIPGQLTPPEVTSVATEPARSTQRYVGLGAIEADRLARKRAALSSHNRELKELQRKQAEKNAVKAYEQRKAETVNADLFG
jgi:hypothetical protein